MVCAIDTTHLPTHRASAHWRLSMACFLWRGQLGQTAGRGRCSCGGGGRARLRECSHSRECNLHRPGGTEGVAAEGEASCAERSEWTILRPESSSLSLTAPTRPGLHSVGQSVRPVEHVVMGQRHQQSNVLVQEVLAECQHHHCLIHAVEYVGAYGAVDVGAGRPADGHRAATADLGGVECPRQIKAPHTPQPNSARLAACAAVHKLLAVLVVTWSWFAEVVMMPLSWASAARTRSDGLLTSSALARTPAISLSRWHPVLPEAECVKHRKQPPATHCLQK